MYQEQFQAALDAVCDEVNLVCQPSKQRAVRGDTADGVTITKARSVPIRSGSITPEYMQQACRTLIQEMIVDAAGGSLLSCFAPSNIWGDATEAFTLRNAKTGVGVSVFTAAPNRTFVVAAWGR